MCSIYSAHVRYLSIYIRLNMCVLGGSRGRQDEHILRRVNRKVSANSYNIRVIPLRFVNSDGIQLKRSLYRVKYNKYNIQGRILHVHPGGQRRSDNANFNGDQPNEQYWKCPKSLQSLPPYTRRYNFIVITIYRARNNNIHQISYIYMWVIYYKILNSTTN